MNALPKSAKLRWAVLVGALTVLAGGFLWFRRTQSRDQWSFETAKVDRGSVVSKVTASGTLSALVTVQVGSQVSGRIQTLLVDFNSTVRKGQLIARIDPQLFDATVAQARANLVAAQGNLSRAEVQALDADRQFKRSASLATQNLIAQADRDTAEATALAAKANVEATRGSVAQAKASLQQALVNLAYTSIVSPINGTVISRSVDVGQTVAASLQAPTLFIIAEDLRKMQVDTSVAEADIGRLTPGMAATFTVDAYPGEHFRGAVRQLRNAATTVQAVVTYDAVIDVDNEGLKLKPGMTANVTFIAAAKDDVVRIPNATLRFRPPAGLAGPETDVKPAKGSETSRERRVVWRLDPLKVKKPEAMSVKLGLSDGTFTEMLEGQLQVGDLLVTDATRPNGRSGTSSTASTPGMRRMF